MNFVMFLIVLSAFVGSMFVVLGRDGGKHGTFGGILLLMLFTLISFIVGTFYYLGVVNGIIFITLAVLLGWYFPDYKNLLMPPTGLYDEEPNI
jgi:hypothetical protein